MSYPRLDLFRRTTGEGGPVLGLLYADKRAPPISFFGETDAAVSERVEAFWQTETERQRRLTGGTK